jgi:hypothetical protein
MSKALKALIKKHPKPMAQYADLLTANALYSIRPVKK